MRNRAFSPRPYSWPTPVIALLGVLAGCADLEDYKAYEPPEASSPQVVERVVYQDRVVESEADAELQRENLELKQRQQELESLLAQQTSTASGLAKVGVADVGPRRALLIGNSKYEGAPLRNPANDARDLAKTLESLGFETEVLIDADYRSMGQALNRFGRALENGGVGLFFFAGHGVQVDGENFLLPTGEIPTEEGDLQYSSLAANQVLAKMDRAKNDLNIVILDACRNNPFARSWRSVSRGLSRVDAPTGAVVIYATAPGMVAYDGDGRNGVFTKHLLTSIMQPNTPLLATIRSARLGVMADTNNQQVPWVSEATTTEFYFHRTYGN